MPPWVASRSPGRSKSRQKRSGGSKTTLGENCLHHHRKAQHPLLYLLRPPPTSDDGFITVQGRKSRDKRPRDPSKDPTPQQRPSKASRSPRPFPLKSESERVANVHTIFEVALNQDRPSSEWVYDHLEEFFPNKTKEQLTYFSNALCLSISKFHLTSACSPPGMCAPVLLLVVEVELPPLENYLHKGELEAQDVRVRCIAAIKWLGV